MSRGPSGVSRQWQERISVVVQCESATRIQDVRTKAHEDESVVLDEKVDSKNSGS